LKNWFLVKCGFSGGSAEALAFLIIIPLMIFFSLILEYLFDEPSKNFANKFCRLMSRK
jgi:hypothetical protein